MALGGAPNGIAQHPQRRRQGFMDVLKRTPQGSEKGFKGAELQAWPVCRDIREQGPNSKHQERVMGQLGAFGGGTRHIPNRRHGFML